MKFLVDAQLPKNLSIFLNQIGYDSIHTLDLIHKNKTSDKEICSISIVESRIVITKDIDFYNSFLQKSEPFKLIYLTVGNLSTDAIIELFKKNEKKIILEISENQVIEISNSNIITLI
jgi:predicted nuclease of predicted toxin-antitoxin system